MNDSTPKRRRAFVLGGGGRWGAVEIGMLRALSEAGIEPDVIYGTSIGAFNGALVAAHPGPGGIETLHRLWHDVIEEDLLAEGVVGRARTLYRLRVAIQSTEPLRELLASVLDVERIEELAIPFQCVAASIERAAEHWFSEGPLIEALLASAAVPGLFPPVAIGGEHFVDGGLVNSVPVDRAVEQGATEVFVLQVGRLEQPLRPPTRFWEPALIAFEIARRHRFNTMRDRHDGEVAIHVLPSGNTVGFDDPRQLKWNDLGDTGALIEGAYRASAAYLSELAGPA